MNYSRTCLVLAAFMLLLNWVHASDIGNSEDSTLKYKELWNRLNLVYEDYKLLAPDGSQGDHLGRSVSVSGDRALVGAFRDVNEYGLRTGSAYVFRFDPGDSTWQFEQKLLASDGAHLDRFGFSVFLFGDIAIVGAHGNDDHGDDSGSAYVFRYDTGKSMWIEEAKLLASDGVSDDNFGYSVTVERDMAMVGAVGMDDITFKGRTYLFRYSVDDSSWIEEAKLVASDGASHDRFGCSVSISGNVAFVGAFGKADWGYCTGAAYGFRFDPDDSTWTEETKLLPTAASTYFGRSVSVCDDIVLIGAEADNEKGQWAGAAYAFRYDENDSTWTREAKLLAIDGDPSDFFGWSVSVKDDIALVGTHEDDYGGDSGEAYIYRYNPVNSKWIHIAKLKPSDIVGHDRFGSSVSLSEDFAIVGAYWDDENANNAGSACVYHLESD